MSFMTADPSISTVSALPAAVTEKTSTLPVISLLGVTFHALSMNDTMDVLETFIREQRPRQVCLSNAYTVALCQKDLELKSVLNKADLVLADGMSIIWGGRWIGAQVPERIAGPDLMYEFSLLAATKGYRIYLMGSTEATLQKLKEQLLTLCPGIQIAGTYSPAMCEKLSEKENLNILEAIRSANAHILFVGMSCPKQEIWISENLHRLPVPVSLGVGAAFDFLSGNVPRAPDWLRKNGLEWLYRLYCEPRRLWRRYLLGNAVFLAALAKASLFQPRDPHSIKK